MDPFCTWLFSMWIVGAAEVSPGWMQIQHLDPIDGQVYVSDVYTEDYLQCFPYDNPKEVQGPLRRW